MNYGRLDRFAGAFYDKLVECRDVSRDEDEISDSDWDELFDAFDVLKEYFIIECNSVRMFVSQAGIPLG